MLEQVLEKVLVKHQFGKVLCTVIISDCKNELQLVLYFC